ncbi:DET1- and DDB1-associated protein 1 isoform X3 [Oryza sativa Japonica Group]|uniref:DET1- and DDB1-associated protein 1 isoform X3 n=1 Tax=Oryza sativa subsp. japonica TaxID=39947 RepID=UPI000E1BA6EA|nr:uncharacterized protein LOC4331465 isoform X3 [Oryza sativa Japonica Group]KAF2937044.1 hypothetical protein DAI22_03g021800 [Oryza sativa Japonica Group]
MESSLGGWPSYNPQNFSQVVPADPSAQPLVECRTSHLHCNTQDGSTSRSRPGRTTKHPGCFQACPLNYLQISVITTDPKNILLRHFYQKSEEKLRPKRAAPDNLTPQNNGKQPRGPLSDGGGSQATASGRS